VSSATSFDPEQFEARWRESAAAVRTDDEGRVVFSQLQQQTEDEDDERNP
jgi:hypothetical protein